MKTLIIVSMVSIVLICCNSDTRLPEKDVPTVTPAPPSSPSSNPPPKFTNNPLGERVKYIDCVVNGWWGPLTTFYYANDAVFFIDKYGGDQIEIIYLNDKKIAIEAITKDDMGGDMETQSTFEYIYTNGRITSVIYQGLPEYPNLKNVYTLSYNTENKITNITCTDPFGSVITSDLIYSGEEVTRLVIKKDKITLAEHNLTYDGKKNPFTHFPVEVKLYLALAEAKGEFKLFDEAVGSFWGEQNIASDNVSYGATSSYDYLRNLEEYQLGLPRHFAYYTKGNIYDITYFYE